MSASTILTHRSVVTKSIGRDEVIIQVLGETTGLGSGPVTPFAAFWWREPPDDLWARRWAEATGADPHVQGQVFHANLDESVRKWRAEGKTVVFMAAGAPCVGPRLG